MTPYEKAQQLLTQLREAALAIDWVLPGDDPEANGYHNFATMGSPVISHESTIVAFTGMDPQSLNLDEAAQAFQNFGCGPGQIGTFIISLARVCNTAERSDGSDDPLLVADASVKADTDATLLWDFASNYTASEFEVPWLTKSFNIRLGDTGALKIVSLSLTIGIE